MRHSFVVLSLFAAVATVSACGSSAAPMKPPATWNEQIVSDPITFPLLQRLQAALGYAA